MSREAMQMALEALERVTAVCRLEADDDYCEGAWDLHNKAITALREALEQPPCKTGAQCVGNKCQRCEAVQQSDNGGKTGWPPGLLQDDDRKLSKWLASKPDARKCVREALPEQAQIQVGCEGEDGFLRIHPESEFCDVCKPAEPQPVAVHQFRKQHCADWYDGHPDHEDGRGPYEVRTLYTYPQRREWQGLTAEEIGNEAKDIYGSSHWDDIKFARAIEAALRERNE
ncbi:hypothetical protein ACT80S_18335 [Ramlibacter sp. MAHUQ-53]|uniref:hypothetical protein n=1 Tax=unclassified Ramlibacter TaxID=2617605 RepID=UPI0036284A25